MTDRYAVINPDTLEAMRRAGHVAKLEARIEKLEAALRKVSAFNNQRDRFSSEIDGVVIEALEGKDD